MGDTGGRIDNWYIVIIAFKTLDQNLKTLSLLVASITHFNQPRSLQWNTLMQTTWKFYRIG
jgi:hypothetical protein